MSMQKYCFPSWQLYVVNCVENTQALLFKRCLIKVHTSLSSDLYRRKPANCVSYWIMIALSTLWIALCKEMWAGEKMRGGGVAGESQGIPVVVFVRDRSDTGFWHCGRLSAQLQMPSLQNLKEFLVTPPFTPNIFSYPPPIKPFFSWLPLNPTNPP